MIDTPLGKVTGVNADHDTVAGSQRGANVLYAFTLEELRVGHFGDDGQAALRPEQVEALGTVGILMLPVGGGPTIDAAAAIEVVRLLQPHYVVPMHYRTPDARHRLPRAGRRLPSPRTVSGIGGTGAEGGLHAICLRSFAPGADELRMSRQVSD